MMRSIGGARGAAFANGSLGDCAVCQREDSNNYASVKKKQRRRNAPMVPVGTYAYESAPVTGLRKRKVKRSPGGKLRPGADRIYFAPQQPEQSASPQQQMKATNWRASFFMTFSLHSDDSRRPL